MGEIANILGIIINNQKWGMKSKDLAGRHFLCIQHADIDLAAIYLALAFI